MKTTLNPESPTQRTIELFTQLNRPYFYCVPLKVWIAEDKCKYRHDLAVNAVPWAVEEGFEESCLNCEKYGKEYSKPKVKRCSGKWISCGNLFEVNGDNFQISPYTKDGYHSRCKKCNNEYIKMLRNRNRNRNKEG